MARGEEGAFPGSRSISRGDDEVKTRILRVVAVLVGSALVLAALTGAVAEFDDSETSANNTIVAGTLDLKVDGADDPLVKKFTVECVSPGDFQHLWIELKNDGCIDGIADLHFKNIVNYENGRGEQELPEDTTSGWLTGELGDNLMVTVAYNSVYPPWCQKVTLNSLECIDKDLGPLDAGDTQKLLITWVLYDDVGNECQSDSVKFDIEFTLHQVPAP